MDENKVQFNLKNTHFAVVSEVEGVKTQGTPVAIPGAVNLNLKPAGAITPFYADGVIYYRSCSNNGYEGDLEIAKVPDSMLKAVWGYLEDSNSVLIENNAVETKEFALLFQIDGDATNSLYVIYGCVCPRPGIASKTNSDTKEPVTQTLSLSSTPLENGDVMARTQVSTAKTITDGWFKSVYLKSESDSQSNDDDTNTDTNNA